MHNRSWGSVAALAAWAAAVALPGPAMAQTPQRIEITGSNIRRVQAESATPIQTITQADIEKSGKGSVAELLQTLAVDNQGSVPMTFGNGFASGASGLSLRGLGAASTLVLINGRRIAPYGQADDGQKVFVDLNTIPSEMVQRVEILKDGASAIYGSDAIAGVVNVILRKDFVGTSAKASVRPSRYGDGTETRASVSHGFGRYDTDGYNVLFSLEAGRKGAIALADRAGRAYVGRSDLRELGYDAQAGLGGTGAILGNNQATSSIVGNVRNPDTLDYWSRDAAAGEGFTRLFPGAACADRTRHPQGDPGHHGAQGCLTDALQEYVQVQPSQRSLNLFGRASWKLTDALQLSSELNLVKTESTTSTTPSSVHSSTGYPGGPVSNAAVSLGAEHPDNPYFGRAARLRYLAADVGPRVQHIDNTFARAVVALRGTLGAWDLDTALLVSQAGSDRSRTGYLQRDATFALLNPTPANVAAARAGSAAYAALPAGSVWRIAENAGLNDPAIYAALSPTLTDTSTTRTTQLDLKLARDLLPLPGGMLGLALGAEVRRESLRLTPTSGTERGNVIGLGYSAYDGARTVAALYGELLAPVSRTLELSAALRADHYSDVGHSVTPKLGLKLTPSDRLAVRTSYAHGFRAPSAAENGKGGLAAFGSARDPLRCDLGVASACQLAPVAIITSPNPELEPETSRSATLGLVFEPWTQGSVSVDLWQIERRDEINQETTTAAIAAGKVARDPSTATQVPGDPGAITAVLARYINSNRTTVRGVDVDLRQGFRLGAAGKLTLSANWTHLLAWRRQDAGGSVSNFVGTHGNCDISNCIGTPADRVNLGLTWDTDALRVALLANHRGALSGRLEQGAGDCSPYDARPGYTDGDCRIASFTTVDLTARWKLSRRVELFGGVGNLFDRKPPLDLVTYGAVSYNPLDYSGAVGRTYSVGLKVNL